MSKRWTATHGNYVPAKWTCVKIRESLLNYLKNYLTTPNARRLGYTNPAQFIDRVVRRRLEQLGVEA